MATPVNDSYSVANGVTAYFGRTAPVVNTGVPAWVPPTGYFADVPMTNTPESLKSQAAAIFGSYADMENPFLLWGGSAILRDYSPLGAQVYYSGGHESSYTGHIPNIQMSLICDFSSLTWKIANLPTVAHEVDTGFPYGKAADGSTYCPHTYLGLQEVPTSWGGGTKGSLASFFWSAATGYWEPAPSPGVAYWVNRINILDVSQTTLGYSQLNTNQFQNADPTKIRFNATTQGGIRGGSYPITAMDETNQGWWVCPADDSGSIYMLFVHKSGLITQYPKFVTFQSGCLAVAKSLNLLIGINGGTSEGSGANNEPRTLYIRNLTTGAVTTSLTLGTLPARMENYGGTAGKTFHRPDEMGLQWVEELGCIVGLDDKTDPPTIAKLTPPSTNPATNQWTWSVVPVSHWSADTSGQTQLQFVDNGLGTVSARRPTLSKFRWVPSLQAFVYGSDRLRKPQVIKIS